jgi:hypothetical protein
MGASEFKLLSISSFSAVIILLWMMDEFLVPLQTSSGISTSVFLTMD